VKEQAVILHDLELIISGKDQYINKNFDVLLTVHLSIFILVINQLDAQNLL